MFTQVVCLGQENANGQTVTPTVFRFAWDSLRLYLQQHLVSVQTRYTKSFVTLTAVCMLPAQHSGGKFPDKRHDFNNISPSALLFVVATVCLHMCNCFELDPQ